MSARKLIIEDLKLTPELDPAFLPAVKWNEAYRSLVSANTGRSSFAMALERRDGTVSVYETETLPHNEENRSLNIKYIERILKFLLWMKGGNHLFLCGDESLCEDIKSLYSPNGERAFDYSFSGKVYGSEMVISICEQIPQPNESSSSLGRNLDGCRIGFDLGGSDRKCAALIDGKVVHSEEIPWESVFCS